MIFVDVPLEEWLKRYPDLQIVQGICDGCGGILRTTIPFRERDYAGVLAPHCCEKQRHTCMAAVTVTERAHREWQNILGPIA